MAIPILHAEMARLIGVYREAWRERRHPGKGRVMIAFHMFCHEDGEEAVRIARDPLNRYLQRNRRSGRRLDDRHELQGLCRTTAR